MLDRVEHRATPGCAFAPVLRTSPSYHFRGDLDFIVSDLRDCRKSNRKLLRWEFFDIDEGRKLWF